jgi:hypothetical protein
MEQHVFQPLLSISGAETTYWQNWDYEGFQIFCSGEVLTH